MASRWSSRGSVVVVSAPLRCATGDGFATVVAVLFPHALRMSAIVVIHNSRIDKEQFMDLNAFYDKNNVGYRLFYMNCGSNDTDFVDYLLLP